jgi:two-component system sensor histidine kinase DegS
MPGTDTSRDQETLHRLARLGEQYRQEADALGRQVSELQLILRQTATEIDRLAPRTNQEVQRVRDMEAHLESYSRADIKEIYASAQESQMRLFMMQLQQEQVEHKLRVLATYQATLSSVVELAACVVPDEGQVVVEASAESAVSSREVLARVLKAQEDERRRVSRQIHDGPAQALANLVLRAEICERLMESNTDSARGELGGLRKLVTASLAETRRFIFDLRPMILDDLGLIPTLRRYCEMIAESSTVPVRLNVYGSERRIDPMVEIALYRVVQESIRNALAHGQPGFVDVTLESDAQAMRATIRDDGRGCDGAAVFAAMRGGEASGLARIEEHVLSLGGSFSFESQPGQGAVVKAAIPISHGA